MREINNSFPRDIEMEPNTGPKTYRIVWVVTDSEDTTLTMRPYETDGDVLVFETHAE